MDGDAIIIGSDDRSKKILTEFTLPTQNFNTQPKGNYFK
jgi:hypothetical protein